MLFERNIFRGEYRIRHCRLLWKRFLFNAKHPFPARNNLDLAVFVLYDLLLIIGEYYP